MYIYIYTQAFMFTCLEETCNARLGGKDFCPTVEKFAGSEEAAEAFRDAARPQTWGVGGPARKGRKTAPK